MLSIRGLHVYYGGIHALRGIDLDDAIEVAANVISMAEVHMDKQKAR